MRKFATTLATLALSCSTFQLQAEDAYKTLVDEKGNIILPDNYPREWTFLGSYFVKNAPTEGMAPGEESFDVHTVYTQPESVSHYRKHGKFPDGAVLIKDVNTTKKEALTTGEARYRDAPKVVFAMVKDDKNRFPENQAWGEGWGWALFEPDNPKSQTVTWKGEGFNNCFACHLPAKHQDWVFTQGYQSVLGK